jgi:hypothetical protein
MNFGQMIDYVKFTLGTQEITSHDESAFVKRWINEGVVDIIVRTRPYSRCVNLTLSANTAVHDMANDILFLLDVVHPDNNGMFLQRYTREDISYRQDSGLYGFAYEEPMLWISPIPSAALTIQAYGGFRPTPMVNNTDDPSSATFGAIAPEFHPAILNYALWKGGEYVQHDQSAMGEKWRVAYEGKDGTEGNIAWIKRILAKRVTPAASRRRDLSTNLGTLSPSGSYIGG